MDPKLLADTVRGLSWSYKKLPGGSVEIFAGARAILIQGGKVLIAEEDRALVKQLRRAYAVKAIEQASRRLGWGVAKVGDSKYAVRRKS